MKRKPVTKTFVRQECTALGKRLTERHDKRLEKEIAGLAGILQRSLKGIESRLAHLELAVCRLQSRKP
jgi:hypothetical protein